MQTAIITGPSQQPVCTKTTRESSCLTPRTQCSTICLRADTPGASARGRRNPSGESADNDLTTVRKLS